jgi:hypothetical protein
MFIAYSTYIIIIFAFIGSVLGFKESRESA